MFFNDQAFRIRHTVVAINNNKPLYYLISVSSNKCNENCNSIEDLYAWLIFPDVVRDMNVKTFNLKSSVNEKRFMSLHKQCKCNCILDRVDKAALENL